MFMYWNKSIFESVMEKGGDVSLSALSYFYTN